MLVKTIIVFLGLMALIALVGRAFFPSVLPKPLRKRAVSGKCTRCGRPQIGQASCDCARGRK